MGKREEYEDILRDLKKSQTEEDVIKHIIKIIKGFTSDYYKIDLYENPYFKSLVPEIRDTICEELEGLKLSLNQEINAIEEKLIKLNETGIISVNNQDISKLRELKRECIILIKELDERLEDLHLL